MIQKKTLNVVVWGELGWYFSAFIMFFLSPSVIFSYYSESDILFNLLYFFSVQCINIYGASFLLIHSDKYSLQY